VQWRQDDLSDIVGGMQADLRVDQQLPGFSYQAIECGSGLSACYHIRDTLAGPRYTPGINRSTQSIGKRK